MMSQHTKHLIEMLETMIFEYHENYRNATVLHEFSEIVSATSNTVRLKNTKFCLVDEGSTIPQTGLIKDAVSYEVQFFDFEWEDQESLEHLKDIKSMELDGETLIVDYWDWDDPDLPKEVINNFEPSDLVGIGSDIEQYYEHLEKINYEEFPKSLLPVIRRAVEKYKNYKNG